MRLPDLYTRQPKTADLARGHWAAIYGSILPELKQTHAKHQPCPSCGGNDRFRLFGDWETAGGAICNQCGNGDGFHWLGQVTGKGFKEVCRLVESVLGIRHETIQIDMAELNRKARVREEAERQQNELDAERNYKRLHQTMSQVVPLSSFEPGLSYLRNRGLGGLIDRDDLPRNWLGHPCLSFDRQQSFPALIAPVVVNNQPVSLHRTYLTQDGSKAPVDDAKKLTPAIWPGATKGGAIRLYWPPGRELAVTEGIETALAIRMALPELPVWACVSANGLESVLIPDGVESVIICADNDASGAGQKAARNLETRLKAEGLAVASILPPCQGLDWLDVARGVAA